MAKQIIEKGLINRFEEVWGVECTLYKPDSYSGTCDAVGVYDGRESIIDFKIIIEYNVYLCKTK